MTEPLAGYQPDSERWSWDWNPGLLHPKPASITTALPASLVVFAKLLPGVAPGTTVLEHSADSVAKMITSSINRALPHGSLRCLEAPAKPQTSFVGTPREAAVGEHYVLSTASKFSPPNWWGREENCLHLHCFSSSPGVGEPGWILLQGPHQDTNQGFL